MARAAVLLRKHLAVLLRSTLVEIRITIGEIPASRYENKGQKKRLDFQNGICDYEGAAKPLKGQDLRLMKTTARVWILVNGKQVSSQMFESKDSAKVKR